jgi:hypothetical protein
MKEISLTQGKIALVDDEDFEALSAFKWRAYRRYRTFYAMRHIHQPDGVRTSEQMHRAILARKLGRPITEGMECDHDNGNGLDNQRGNLFEVTKAQNRHNFRRYLARTSSMYVGVYWQKNREKWCARIQVDGKSLFLGRHSSEVEAAQVRDAYVSAHPELHARLNFSHEGAP